MPHAHQRAVDRIEDDFADARVVEQHPLLAGVNVDRHQIAVGEVVIGEKGGAGLRIVGKRSDAIEHRTLDVGEPSFGAVARVERADVLDESRIAKRGVDRPGLLVEVHPRNRSHRMTGERAIRRDRILAQLREVRALQFVLELDPILPRLLERQPEHLLKIVRVVARAIVVTSNPGDDLFGRIRVGEIREEARAVEIRVRRDLKVNLDAARHEPERIVEVCVVAHHRAKHHLVVAALRATESPVHPRFHEHRAAFGIPPRGGEAGDGQVAVEQRFGIL